MKTELKKRGTDCRGTEENLFSGIFVPGRDPDREFITQNYCNIEKSIWNR